MSVLGRSERSLRPFFPTAALLKEVSDPGFFDSTQNDGRQAYSKSSFTPASTLIVGAGNPNSSE